MRILSVWTVCLFLVGCQEQAAEPPQPEEPTRPAAKTAAEESSPAQNPVAAAPEPAVPQNTEPVAITFAELNLAQILEQHRDPATIKNQFPEPLRKLEGRTVRIQGYMAPWPFDVEEVPRFTLTSEVRDYRDLKQDETILVLMKSGTAAPYKEYGLVKVEGTLKFDPRLDAKGEWYQLYQISDASIILPAE